MAAVMETGPAVAPDAQWVDVCPRELLMPELGVCAQVGAFAVAVFHLPDAEPQLFAVGNIDPFNAASVLSRGIVGDLKGEWVVASPLHKHHFSLTKGVCLEDPRVRIPVFAVRVAEGMIQVADRPISHGADERGR
ncbi:MAG: nitrite reductase small subunit NirD [Candidatus Competibacterales bacterium]